PFAISIWLPLSGRRLVKPPLTLPVMVTFQAAPSSQRSAMATVLALPPPQLQLPPLRARRAQRPQRLARTALRALATTAPASTGTRYRSSLLANAEPSTSDQSVRNITRASTKPSFGWLKAPGSLPTISKQAFCQVVTARSLLLTTK